MSDDPRLKNLKPWKKGQSGNPAGRAPWKSAEEMFAEFLQEELEVKGVTKTRIEWLKERVFRDAMSGNTRAQALVMDRTFGKAKQTIAHEGEVSVNDNRKDVVQRFLERTKKT